MDKSLLVKLVWLGAIAAIPVAVLSLQKPTVTLPAETRRVMTMDKPVAVDIRGGPGPRAARDSQAARAGGQAEDDVGWWRQDHFQACDRAARRSCSGAAPAAKDDHVAIPAKDPSKLTASVAPSPGPRAQ